LAERFRGALEAAADGECHARGLDILGDRPFSAAIIGASFRPSTLATGVGGEG
jgi:hypothetical protein